MLSMPIMMISFSTPLSSTLTTLLIANHVSHEQDHLQIDSHNHYGNISLFIVGILHYLVKKLKIAQKHNGWGGTLANLDQSLLVSGSMQSLNV